MAYKHLIAYFSFRLILLFFSTFQVSQKCFEIGIFAHKILYTKFHTRLHTLYHIRFSSCNIQSGYVSRIGSSPPHSVHSRNSGRECESGIRIVVWTRIKVMTHPISRFVAPYAKGRSHILRFDVESRYKPREAEDKDRLPRPRLSSDHFVAITYRLSTPYRRY